MEIDLGTTIFGLIVMALCTLPFVIDYRNKKKKAKHLLQSLHVAAQQENCQISQHESCGDFTIGLDEQRNYVFFMKQKKDIGIFQNANLSEFNTCQTVKKTRTLKNNDKNVTITERVELRFSPENKSKSETRFELYDEALNKQLTGELQFAAKWSDQINRMLSSKK